jgi:predicted DNA-binding transcriptional regulator AlpA
MQADSSKGGVEALLSTAQVAAILGVPLQTLYRWRSVGSPVPQSIRIGKHLRYRPQAVRDFIAERDAATKAAG